MLPGKSANTFTIYVDTPTNSSIKQTQTVTSCIVDFLKKEKEITDIETTCLKCNSIKIKTITNTKLTHNEEKIDYKKLSICQKCDFKWLS
jgi:multidrug efflux pump subunit AcrB